MKSKDLQKVVLSKYQNDDNPTKIYRDLNGGIGLKTIERWCQMIHRSSSVKLSSSPGGPRFARTKGNIQKVKYRLRRKERVSTRKLSMARRYFREKCSANNQKRCRVTSL